MLNLTSPKWWCNQFITVFITMVFIYIIKTVSVKYNVPIVKNVSENI